MGKYEKNAIVSSEYKENAKQIADLFALKKKYAV